MVKNIPPLQTLADAETLAQHLDDDSWAIFDCRFSLPQPERGLQAYRESHVPGAVYADLDKDLSSAPTPGMSMRGTTIVPPAASIFLA